MGLGLAFGFGRLVEESVHGPRGQHTHEEGEGPDQLGSIGCEERVRLGPRSAGVGCEERARLGFELRLGLGLGQG